MCFPDGEGERFVVSRVHHELHNPPFTRVHSSHVHVRACVSVCAFIPCWLILALLKAAAQRE